MVSAKPCRWKDYTFDLDAIGGAIDDHTRVIFLANPNNPTGTNYRRDAWERLLARVPDHVVVVADEAYFEFVRDPDYPNALNYLADHSKLIVLRTFSKIFGLAGLRVGYGVAHPRWSACSTTCASRSISTCWRRPRWSRRWTTMNTCGAPWK